MTRDVPTDPPADVPARRPPAAAQLDALDSDAWAWFLRHVRRALHDLEDLDVTPVVARLRAAPAGRLAGGRSRRDLTTLLSRGGPAWHHLQPRLDAAGDVPDAVAAMLAGQTPDAPPTAPAPGVGPGERDEVRRLRARLRQLRAERDELLRRLEGAEARAARTATRADRQAASVTDLEVERDRLRLELADAAHERARAVERERRRRDGELTRLGDELADLRRADQERRVEHQRLLEERTAARRASDRRTAGHPASDRIVPGRPSELPPGVVAGTREAVDVLLHPGRLVLVDGYNVTKRHHDELPLEQQRAWLVRQLGAAVARRRIRAVVIFDGAGDGGRPAAGMRDVTVRFTPAGVTADDELVLTVEATDEPVVVVTDDRELTGRLRVSGADVVGAQPFLWALR